MEEIELTLDEIRSNEHNKETVLKKKREIEDEISYLSLAIKKSVAHAERCQKEIEELSKKSDCLRSKLELERLRLKTIASQVENETLAITNLRAKMTDDLSKICKLRVGMCQQTHHLLDEYDVWTLMSKPLYKEVLPSSNVTSKLEVTEYDEGLSFKNKERLQEALQRRQDAQKKRDLLMIAPEVSDDFKRSYLHLIKNMRRNYCSFVNKENEPIKFSTSRAANPGVIRPIRNKVVDMPWYQPYIVIGSVTIFMIYFCVLREENDVDDEFTKTLYQRIDGLEKKQLLLSYKYNKENGKSVEEIERRLKEIEAEENAKLSQH